jgi:hypothetical protein
MSPVCVCVCVCERERERERKIERERAYKARQLYNLSDSVQIPDFTADKITTDFTTDNYITYKASQLYNLSDSV